MDRKKLEPIKNNTLNYNPNLINADSLSTGHSITENDNTLSHTNNNFNTNNNSNNYNDEELSISENTLSSEKQSQQMNGIRISKKKVKVDYNPY